MKIEFNFSLNIDGKESLSRTVEFEAEDSHRAEILAVQIIKQLEKAKLDAEFDYIYDGRCGSTLHASFSTNTGNAQGGANSTTALNHDNCNSK